MRAISVRQFVIILFALSISTVSLANQRSTSKNAFLEGMSFQKNRNYLLAIDSFEKSLQLFPTKIALFNLAICHLTLHHYSSAIRLFKQLLTQYNNELSSKMSQETKQHLTRLEYLNRQAARLAIRVNQKDARVNIDGQFMALTPLTKSLTLPPGKHTLTITKANFETVVKTVVLLPKEYHEEEIRLFSSIDELNAKTTPQPPGPEILKPTPSPTAPNKMVKKPGLKLTGSILFISLGAAGFGVGSYFCTKYNINAQKANKHVYGEESLYNKYNRLRKQDAIGGAIGHSMGAVFWIAGMVLLNSQLKEKKTNFDLTITATGISVDRRF